MNSLNKSLLFALAAMIAGLAASSVFTGCSKQESPAPAPSAAPATASPVADVKKQVGDVAKSVTDAASQASSKATALIDQAKAQIASKNYTEALASLNQLGGMNLGADQQKLVDGLKEQIQTAMRAQAAEAATKSAAKSVGGLIPGTK